MPFSLTSEQKQTAFWLSVWLCFVLLLYALGPILTPFIAAAILAYALNGLVDYLDHLRIAGRFSLPRPIAVVLVMLLFLLAVTGLVLIVVPVLQQEIPLLKAQIPLFLDKFNEVVAPRLQELGIKVRLDSTSIKDLLTEQFATGSDEMWSTALAKVRVGGAALLGWLAMVVLIPVLLFYLLMDWHQILARVTGAVPRRWVASTVAMGEEVNHLLAQYLRGQLLVMLVLAVYYSVALSIAGFDVALPVGILTGLLVFIPYLGFGLGLLLALPASAVLMVAFRHLRHHYLRSSFYNA